MSTSTIRFTRVPTLCKALSSKAIIKPAQAKTMSTFFPRFPNSDFAPLFRFIDDYDVHRSHRHGPNSNSNSNANSLFPTTPVRSFQPKFDVSEEKDSYLLEGELPGIEQENVLIEFSDPHTIVIKGKVERVVRSSSPASSNAIEDAAAAAAGQQKAIASGTETPKSHKATVEDESVEDGGQQQQQQQQVATTTTPTTEQSVEKAIINNDNKPAQQPAQPQSKYWVSERSVGEFHRSFQFPARVDQDAVKASMKNGVLKIVVPKAVNKPGRRIAIE